MSGYSPWRVAHWLVHHQVTGCHLVAHKTKTPFALVTSALAEALLKQKY
jgi:hypothetical protein